jgi:hemolysin activation/secretion protein
MLPNFPLHIYQSGVRINLLVLILLGLSLPATSAEVNSKNSVEEIKETVKTPTISPRSALLRSSAVPLNSPERALVIPNASSGIVNQQHSASQRFSTTQEEVSPDNIPDTISVGQFLFVDGTCKPSTKTPLEICKVGKFIFSHEELEKVIKTALGIENFPVKLTFAQLLYARSAITQYYINKGYITSGAYIPEQDFEKGDEIIKIAIIEGHLESIEITGKDEKVSDKSWNLYTDFNNSSDQKFAPRFKSSRTSNDYFSESDAKDEEVFATCLATQLNSAETLNQGKLVDRLRLLQEFYPHARFHIALLPGNNPGRNKLNVTATNLNKDKKETTWNLELATDNNQSPSVGSWSQQIKLLPSIISPWKSNETLFSLGFTRTEGVTGFDGAALISRREAQCRNNVFDIRFGTRESRIIARPFNELDIQSKSNYANVTWKTSIQSRLDWGEVWGASFFVQSSDTSLLGIRFPISPGANDTGETRIAGLRLSYENAKRSPSSALGVRGELSIGGNLSTRPAQDTFLKPFILLRGQGQWAKLVTPDIVLALEANMQLAATTLPALEQLSLGGQDTIRGYRKNLLLTDNGFLSSAELRLTIAKAQDWRIKLIPFMDFGIGWNHPGNFDIPITNTLWSTGIGLLVQNGDSFNARVDWGIPLNKTNFSGDSLQDQGIYFSVSGILKF